jgi:hypothetical protein
METKFLAALRLYLFVAFFCFCLCAGFVGYHIIRLHRYVAPIEPVGICSFVNACYVPR